MPGPIVTLLTDFGLQDNSVGAMKGVILGICPDAHLADICHGVPRQNVEAGGFLLERTYRYYPKGTVHVAVVDPGVGGKRRPMAMRRDGHLFVAPDNGLLTAVRAHSERSDEDICVELSDPAYRLAHVSNTFHGRDIFAPAGGHLAAGVDIRDLGPAFEDPVELPLQEIGEMGDRGVWCHIVYIDVFGNLVTDLSGREAAHLESVWGEVWMTAGEVSIGPLQSSYDAVPVGEYLISVGGFDRVEVSINRGSAHQKLGVGYGDSVLVHPRPSELA